MNTYDRFRAMAIRRLSLVSDGGLGAPLLITRKESTYNVNTSKTEFISTVFNTTGLRNNYRRFDIDGTLIKETDVNFYISPICTITTPDPNWIPDVGQTEDDRPSILVEQDTPSILSTDEITFDSVKYKVITVRPWNHAMISIGFKVQARTV